MIRTSQPFKVDAETGERRSQPRRRVLKGGVVRFNNGNSVYECIVRNLSDHGARLTFGDATHVPSQFDLRIESDGISRRAVVQWRRDEAIGIRLA